MFWGVTLKRKPRCSRFNLTVWLVLILSDAVLAQTAEYNGGSIYELDPPAMQSTGTAVLESIQQADDMEEINQLGVSDFMRQLASPVGRLGIQTDEGVAYCTASLISSNRILTNNHCVPGVGGSAAVFQLGYLQAGSTAGVTSYDVNMVPLETNAALDYSILELMTEPGSEWGAIELSTSDPSPRNSLFVIHHPGGFSKRLSRGHCAADDPAIVGDDLRHICDTLGGSSGAPIFDNDTRKVVGLHNRSLGLNVGNSSIRMASIAAASPILAGIISPGITPPPPTLPSPDFSGVDVVYYKKDADGGRIEQILNDNAVPFHVQPSVMRGETNVVSCTPDVDFNSVKHLALVLHDAGFAIYSVREHPNRNLTNRINIESYVVSGKKSMARSEIENLQSCHNREPERLTGREIWVLGEEYCGYLIETLSGAANDFIVDEPGSPTTYLNRSLQEQKRLQASLFRENDKIDARCYASPMSSGLGIYCPITRTIGRIL